MSLIAIDLFSGCGGLTLGLQQAGFRVIGAVECDPLAIETYQLNHDEVDIWDTDIQSIDIPSFKKKLGIRKRSLDLLAACPPCQGFSSVRTLNKNQSVQDERNDLVLEFLRFALELMPKAIVFENVPGIIKDWRFTYVCEKLKSVGYSVRYRLLDAADYGVPQRRKRAIVLAGRFGDIPFAPPSLVRSSVREAIGQLEAPGSSGDPLHDSIPKRSNKVEKLIRRIPCDGGSRSALGAENQLPCHKRTVGFRDVYGRMAWDDVAPTITTGCTNPSKGRFLHPTQHRAITVREASLLQTFPSLYKFSMSGGRSGVARMLGNAFPPEFMRRIVHYISIYLRSKRR